MLRKILVPLDGSRPSEKALPYAERLARASSAQLILVRVTASGVPSADSGQTGYTGAQAYIDSLVATLGQRGLAVETATPSGDPAAEILDEVRFRRADLVVMATHGDSGPGRWLYGSVADAVLRGAGVPVVIVPPGAVPPWPGNRPPRFLVPLDGSRLGETVLPVVHAWAASLGAEIVLLQVVVWPPYVFGDGAEIITLDPEIDLDAARAYLAHVAKQLGPPNVTVRCRAETGRPVPAVIARVAGEEHTDLIAMATHGRSGFSRLVLGSVATGTLQRACVPLLLVRPLVLEQSISPEPSHGSTAWRQTQSSAGLPNSNDLRRRA
jgi:nucleotide-binding universal stress UspA family protein